ncbi:LEF-6 [Plodia interpunctella granulovirus]|uniref:LEF-6 n=1 Tax=Plodia interpunctella granulovirus TaxID=262175 RepID=A0A1L5JHG7_9BBAC|nr:LEF-6 [Plodia interpunctella granulovirus]APO13950.1 LEF-6 [Plodia interpunctella granulovirus]
MLFHHTKLYLHGINHPLWLTKTLMGYIGDEQIANSVDWNRSTRHVLMVKRKSVVHKIKAMSFYYPDGKFFHAREGDDADNVEREDDEEEESQFTVHDFWHDDDPQ